MVSIVAQLETVILMVVAGGFRLTLDIKIGMRGAATRLTTRDTRMDHTVHMYFGMVLPRVSVYFCGALHLCHSNRVHFSAPRAVLRVNSLKIAIAMTVTQNVAPGYSMQIVGVGDVLRVEFTKS